MSEDYLGPDVEAGSPLGDEDDTEAQHEHAAGSIGDEALRVVSAVQDWARRTFPEGPAEHRNDCTWCPVCQFLAVLRGERPEVTERVAEAGTALVTALRALVDATGAPGAAAGAHRHPGESRHEQPRPRVERIDLRDAPAGEA